MGTKDVPLGHVIYPITTISRYVILIAIWHFTGTISLVVLPSLANVVNIYTFDLYTKRKRLHANKAMIQY